MGIVFSYLGIKEQFTYTAKVRKLIYLMIKEEEKRLGEINIIFTSNSKILEINREYLKHSYFTDVIAFNNNKRDELVGEIYISVDQVNINAKRFRVSKKDELVRVVIHGVLHLIGYNDKLDEERFEMRCKEEKYLCEFNKMNSVEKA